MDYYSVLGPIDPQVREAIDAIGELGDAGISRVEFSLVLPFTPRPGTTAQRPKALWRREMGRTRQRYGRRSMCKWERKAAKAAAERALRLIAKGRIP